MKKGENFTCQREFEMNFFEMFTHVTSGNLKSLSRLNSKKKRIIQSKYESSFPELPRSNVLRTWRTKLLNADCNISIANCRKNNLNIEVEIRMSEYLFIIHSTQLLVHYSLWTKRHHKSDVMRDENVVNWNGGFTWSKGHCVVRWSLRPWQCDVTSSVLLYRDQNPLQQLVPVVYGR